MSMPATLRPPSPTAVRPSRSPRLPRSRKGQVALLAAILLPIILCVELVFPPGGQRHAVSTPASGTTNSTSAATGTSNSTSAAAAVDPRLVLHPHTTSITGSLAGGLKVSGTLSPTIPGKNTLRLALRSANGQPVPAGHVSLVVTMPGMSMPPIRATLHAQGSAYASTIRIPMFGRYHATVTFATPTRHYTGAMAVNLPLPL